MILVYSFLIPRGFFLVKSSGYGDSPAQYIYDPQGEGECPACIM